MNEKIPYEALVRFIKSRTQYCIEGCRKYFDIQNDEILTIVFDYYLDVIQVKNEVDDVIYAIHKIDEISLENEGGHFIIEIKYKYCRNPVRLTFIDIEPTPKDDFLVLIKQEKHKNAFGH